MPRLPVLSLRPEPPRTFGTRHMGGFASPTYTYSLKRTIPSVRDSFTHTSPRRPMDRYWNIDQFVICLCSRIIIRSRLTLARLALTRKPWPIGGRVSRPPCRYLCLHLLFRALQNRSRDAFPARGMLPYRIKYPKLRWRAYARLLSMPCRSTSELLRTL